MERTSLRNAPATTFHGTAPLRLRGPNLPTLAVALGSLLFARDQLPRIPEFVRFDTG